MRSLFVPSWTEPETPLASGLRSARPTPGPWLSIVGVVAASRQFSLEASPEKHIFVPYFQLGDLAPIFGRGLYLAGRSSTPAEASRAMKSKIAALDPTLAVR